MTYTELVTFVADICENTFPTVDMDMFIKQAEQKIYNTVQIANLRKNVTGLTTANNKYLSAPNDFLSVYSIAIYPLSGTNANEYTYLLNKDVNFIRYMKGEPDMIALYQSMYDRAMIQLKQLGDGKQRQDAYRDGQARVQVV